MEIMERWSNATEGHGIGASGWYEPFTDDKAVLFRFLQSEYGGCVSKMWRTVRVTRGFTAFGVVVPPVYRDVRCGWVFQQRDRYEDAEPGWPDDRATYTRETWVEVMDPPAEWGWEDEQP
jgi:hypothetical protein